MLGWLRVGLDYGNRERPLPMGGRDGHSLHSGGLYVAGLSWVITGMVIPRTTMVVSGHDYGR